MLAQPEETTNVDKPNRSARRTARLRDALRFVEQFSVGQFTLEWFTEHSSRRDVAI